MIASGHDFQQIGRYTPDQFNLFMSLANVRLAEDQIDNARAAVIGGQAGMTGNIAPLRSLESALKRMNAKVGQTPLQKQVRGNIKKAFGEIEAQDHDTRKRRFPN